MIDPTMLRIAAVWESLLGFVLVFGFKRKLAEILGIATFTLLSAVNAHFCRAGFPNCGCLGVLSVNPCLMVLFTTLMGGLLAVSASSKLSEEFLHRRARFALVSGLVILPAVVTAIVGIFPLQRAFSYVRGDAVLPVAVDFGTVSQGQLCEIPVSLQNISNQPLRLVGGTSDCSCNLIASLPIVIAPGASENVVLQIDAPRQPGIAMRAARVWTDSATQPQIILHLKCTVE